MGVPHAHAALIQFPLDNNQTYWEVHLLGHYGSCLEWRDYRFFQNFSRVAQGDPLSPFLFVIYLERLSMQINRAVSDNIWKTIDVCRGGPSIPHLLFADDLLLFARANTKQEQLITTIIDDFCKYSSQSISIHKSVAFTGPGFTVEMKKKITSIRGIKFMENLGKYLGIPLLNNRASKENFNYIVEKVQARLSGWKSKNLSLADRCTLINSVLAGIPLFAMQTAWLPQAICDALNKLNGNFLRGSSSEKRRIHLVKWEEVTKQKKMGGLRIRESRMANVAQLAKIGSRIACVRNKVSAQVLCKK